ncbi:hypothetical protein IWQ60_005716 [Tieghemiomyces parasiticus]|uniref:Uncharacterized protein n=1 Tax=Tieghemiomyces parasiticus TaxID=78921 RepID=A0A9W8DYM1_9FUNG|nr:hypothetical protein IWQ60_005716 [Tieghemiomyces parasiticus]
MVKDWADGFPKWFQPFIRRTRYRRVLYCIGILILWLCIVPPVYKTFLYQGGKADTLESFRTSDSLDYIDVTLVAQEANLKGHKLQTYIMLQPQGKYRRGYAELTMNVTANFASKGKTFKVGRRMESFDLSVPLTGHERLFPFDTYDSNFAVYLREGNQENGTAIPLRTTLYGSIQTLDFDTVISQGSPGEHIVYFSMAVARTKITLFFSIYICILQWALALAISTLAFQVAITRRQIPPALLTCGTSLLFALPALRNSQPGIPALGCASDILAYFWCLIIVAFSAVSNLLLTVVRKEKVKKDDKASDKAPDTAPPERPTMGPIIVPVDVSPPTSDDSGSV